MSTIPSPFWVFHNWFQNRCNQFCWWSEYSFGKTAVTLGVLSMTIGLCLIVFAVFLIEPVTVWFLGALPFAPWFARSNFERQYKINTRQGFKNSLQSEWLGMVILHLFYLFGALIALALVQKQEFLVMCFLVGGSYFVLPVFMYLLATDPIPGNYEPGRRVRYARA